MIRTWVADVSALMEEEYYLNYYRKVPEERQEKADTIIPQSGKALSVGAWVLLQMMREKYGLDEEAVFNLSHSGQYALCSVDDSSTPGIQLGCDIEEVKQLRLNVAEHYFCESELEYIIGQKTEEEQKQAFYRYWVLKESFMKATRMGMKLGLSEFEIKIEGKKSPYLLKQPKEFGDNYYYKEYVCGKIPYKIAVCSTDSVFSEEIRKVTL